MSTIRGRNKVYKIEERQPILPSMIKAANEFGGKLAYSSDRGTYVMLGYGDTYTELHRGDTIVRKGQNVVITRGWIKREVLAARKRANSEPLTEVQKRHLDRHMQNLKKEYTL